LYAPELPHLEASGVAPIALHNLFAELVAKAPAGGGTAQAIIGSILRAQHEHFGILGRLGGIGESVQTTNTTSGKPGDFFETFAETLHVYEVTTKKVDVQRVRESAEAVRAYLTADMSRKERYVEVSFLCRENDLVLLEWGVPKKLPTTIEVSGVTYHFVDLWQWVFYALERLGDSGRKRASDLLEDYITDLATRVDVKNAWKELLQPGGGVPTLIAAEF
jgi:hypothetical protein